MQTYENVRDAFSVLKPLMKLPGLRGATQIALIRLWKSISTVGAIYAEAELAAVKEYGELGKDGKTIQFPSEEAKAGYTEKIGEMLRTEIEQIEPVHIGSDPALFSATTPEQLAALAPFMIFEEERKAE